MTDPKIILSLCLAVALGLVGLSLRAAVRRFDLSPEQRRRTKNMIVYGVLVALVGILTIAWAEELAAAALVASGFAVALVLFNKELVLNVLGWWVKTMGGAFRIGDRISVGSVRGDVIDYGVLTTTLMEVEADADHGMRTGNVITLPNAKLLSEPVLNETRILTYEWKEISFELADGEDWRAAESALMAEATVMVAEYRNEVVRELKEMSDHFAFHPIQVEPHVFVKSMPGGGVRLWVRMALPARRIAVLADRLNRVFLQWQRSTT